MPCPQTLRKISRASIPFAGSAHAFILLRSPEPAILLCKKPRPEFSRQITCRAQVDGDGYGLFESSTERSGAIFVALCAIVAADRSIGGAKTVGFGVVTATLLEVSFHLGAGLLRLYRLLSSLRPVGSAARR